ncbi:hypothetical protein [Paenibacillus alvei]|uniref:Uncharacterized protein n=1 Tax=Paenibacillus alvei TaxID=44250 RepID=A0AAP7A095_PAEAL|nr:hypothetical protein [Paenibacillus alvei]NOJ71427.1 hypothetical protein [Paenibacillus alvei]
MIAASLRSLRVRPDKPSTQCLLYTFLRGCLNQREEDILNTLPSGGSREGSAEPICFYHCILDVLAALRKCNHDDPPYAATVNGTIYAEFTAN